MSLLQIQNDPVHEHDASSEGEDYAKGSSYMLWAVLVATVVLVAGSALFYFLIHKPPVAAGEVTQAWAKGVHTLSAHVDAAGVEAQAEQFDQVLVLANVRIHNQSKEPIVLREMMTNATFEDGIHSSYVATATDYDRIFVAYPELSGLHSKTLTRETVIQPGQTVDGELISSFHVTKAQWTARKDVNWTIQFKFHPDLVLTMKAPITEL
jgi:hypothetical protein